MKSPWLAMLCAPLVLLAGAAGCSGGGEGRGGSASVNGTLLGAPMSAADAAAGVLGQSSGAGASSSTVIEIGSAAGLCQAASTGVLHRNEEFLVFQLGQVAAADSGMGGTIAVSAPGTFTIYDPYVGGTTQPAAWATVVFTALDATCGFQQTLIGASGTLTVSKVSGGAAGTLTGSFDVTFEDREHVTGSFTAPGCAALGNPAPACSASSPEAGLVSDGASGRDASAGGPDGGAGRVSSRCCL